MYAELSKQVDKTKETYSENMYTRLQIVKLILTVVHEEHGEENQAKSTDKNFMDNILPKMNWERKVGIEANRTTHTHVLVVDQIIQDISVLQKIVNAITA